MSKNQNLLFLLLCIFFNFLLANHPIVDEENIYSIDLSVYDGDGSLLLIWSYPDSIQPKNIQIFRKNSEQFEYSLISNPAYNEKRYLDLNCKPELRFFYKVEIEDIFGQFYTSDLNTPSFGSCQFAFDTLSIEQEDTDRVYVSGCRGSTPPSTHKACINLAGGYRNGMDLVLTGLDIEEKAEAFTNALFNSVGGKDQFDEVSINLHRTDKENPNSNEEAMATLSLSVKSNNPDLVGRLFSAKIIELSLANYPGFFSGGGGKKPGPVIVYWPALVDSKHIKEYVHLKGDTTEIIPTSQLNFEENFYQKNPIEIAPALKGNTKEIPFGQLYGARSGDKGGCANMGVWAKTDKAFSFLYEFLTVEKLKELLPDLNKFDIDRYDLPNIKSLNFYIHGILEDGVSSNNRKDGQAKSLGEYLRAKFVEIPIEIIEGE